MENKGTVLDERKEKPYVEPLLHLVERTHGLADYLAEGMDPQNLESHIAAQVEINLKEIKRRVQELERTDKEVAA